MAYVKFELQPIGEKRFKKKRYFSDESKPADPKIAGMGLSFRPRMNGERILPIQVFNIEPEKYVRKASKEGVEEYEQQLTKNQLTAAHIKFLWQNGWPVKKIVQRLGCKLNTAYSVVSGKSQGNILPVRPPWWGS